VQLYVLDISASRLTRSDPLCAKQVGHQPAAACAEAFKFDVAAVYLKFNDADLREIYDQTSP
jgi:hypothetical protein